MTSPDAPTQAGFIVFLRTIAGIGTTVLADASPAIPFAYKVAIAIVNPLLCACPPMYELAVYNLGTSNILNFAQDVPDAPPVKGSDLPYFQFYRNKWNISGFVSGTISSASDEGTSTSLVVPKAAETFTLADLQYLKDPYGRQYLAIAQRFGTLWGLS